MLFNSLEFIIFFPIVVLLFYLVPVKCRKIWLLLANCYFYACFSVSFLFILAGCILCSYLWGILLEKYSNRIVLFLGVGVLSAILLFFRFFALTPDTLVIPIGMSFYMLQAIGYLIDIYKNKNKAEHNLIDYAIYMSFFPTIISGPIKRADDFLKQLKLNTTFEYKTVRSGLYLMAWGLVEKVVVADTIGKVVNMVYKNLNGSTGFQILFATLLYGIQLYCDFAGYSYIAIGASKVLGFNIQQNFKQPYFAISIKDFWHRWHISLSSWLRDYVYFPLGGSRCSKVRKYINLLITFLASGLWHGSGFNYIFWGVLHGGYQVLGDMFAPIRKKISIALYVPEKSWILRVIRSFFVFLLVDFAWLFFRAPSFRESLRMLKAIIFDFHPEQLFDGTIFWMGLDKTAFISWLMTFILVCIVDIIHEMNISIESRFIEFPLLVRWSVYLFITFSLLYVGVLNVGQDASSFIYGSF